MPRPLVASSVLGVVDGGDVGEQMTVVGLELRLILGECGGRGGGGGGGGGCCGSLGCCSSSSAFSTLMRGPSGICVPIMESLLLLRDPFWEALLQVRTEQHALTEKSGHTTKYFQSCT